MTSDTHPQDNIEPAREVDRYEASSLTFSPGARAIIEDLSGGSGKLHVEVVGAKQCHYILFHYPKSLSDKFALEDNAPVLVRSMCRNHHLCAFRTTVIKNLKAPVRLLILRYPEQFDALNMRRYDRIESVVRVEIFFQGNDYKGVIVNLSRGGCRIIVRSEPGVELPTLNKDNEVFLIFTLPGHDEELTVAGQCREVNLSGERLSVGIAFMFLPDKMAQIIDDFVLDLKSWLRL
ncbi:PilZ domain-containing protein [Desulfovibrio inopinatus]|uniref:PilZ domain-containing protein n=1 Tax=Desulfovibrio inopinatus TaxID=102109 RepID=UPI00042921AF|nr:PilZ domain-containing protein [Desulfovibrio inopinatus]